MTITVVLNDFCFNPEEDGGTKQLPGFRSMKSTAALRLSSPEYRFSCLPNTRIASSIK